MAIDSDVIHKRLLDVAGEFGFLSDNATLLLEHVAEDIAEHPENADVEVAEEPTYVLTADQLREAVVAAINKNASSALAGHNLYVLACEVVNELKMEG